MTHDPDDRLADAARAALEAMSQWGLEYHPSFARLQMALANREREKAAEHDKAVRHE